MSAFCVFGMTEPLAKKMAEQSSATWLAKLPADERAAITQFDVSGWVKAKTTDLLKTARPRQVSGTFDAPQFAKDWINLANRSVRVRGLRIMMRGEKVDKHGGVVISKTTKQPTIGWVPFER